MSRDPGAPSHPERRDLALLCGFVVCLVIAVVTVVLPELGGGEPERKDAPPGSTEDAGAL